MRTRARTMLVLASSSALFGCQPGCETGGLSDLFETSPTYIRFPGRQLAKGHFSSFGLDGTPGEHGFLLVRDEDELDQDKRGALTVVPIQGGKPCQVGPAARYSSFLSMFRLLNEDQRQIQGYIPFLPSVDGSGTGTLQFATFGCEVSSTSLPGVRWPLIGTGTLLSPPKFIAIQSDGKLSTVSPWDGTSKSVAESVTDATFDGSYFWTRQGGQLVLRDSSLSEVASYGAGVTGYRMDGGGTGYFLDSEGLYRVDGPDKPAKLLEPGACGLSTPRGASNYVATLAPCADAQLILLDPTTLEKHPLATGATTDVFASLLRGPDGTQQYFIYTTDVDPTTGLGKLWAVVLREKEEEDEQVPELISEAVSMRSLGSPVDGRLPLIVDSVGGIGRLVLWSPKDGMQEIAKDVSDFNLPLILEKFDATTGTGTLSFRHANGKLQRLASGVPNLPNSGQSFAYKDKDTGKDYNYRAILRSFENKVGDLALISQDGDSVEVSSVADSVRRGAYLFFEFANALTYLKVDGPEAPTGRLEVLFLATLEKFGTDGVSEWMGMDWPEVGIAYAVQEGKQAGIWWGALQ